MSGKVTLEQLAEELGVSRQTVSNVINAPHRVKESTRRKVADAIARSGFRPNSAARQLRTHRSMNLGMRLQASGDGINGAVLDGFLHRLTEAAQSSGYRLTLFCAETDGQEIDQYQELVHMADLDGFVLTGTHRGDTRTQWLAKNAIPFVAFGRPWDSASEPTADGHSWVDIDGRAGVRAATEHFIRQGHRKIGFIGWPEGSGVGDDRLFGWREATAGFSTHDDGLIHRGDDSAVVGSEGAAALCARGATAVVCASDSLALGAVAHLSQSATPELAANVIGFDDTPVARAMGMTSVAQPVAQAAEQVVRIMLARLKDPDAAPEQILLEPQLQLRELHSFTG